MQGEKVAFREMGKQIISSRVATNETLLDDVIYIFLKLLIIGSGNLSDLFELFWKKCLSFLFANSFGSNNSQL